MGYLKGSNANNKLKKNAGLTGVSRLLLVTSSRSGT